MAKEILKIKGMSCNHCKMAVENELRAIDGVKSVNVSLEKNIAEIEYDSSKAGIEEFKKAIEEAGYEVVG